MSLGTAGEEASGARSCRGRLPGGCTASGARFPAGGRSSMHGWLRAHPQGAQAAAGPAVLRDEAGKPEHPLLGIQHGAGNRAVAGLVAMQRQGPAAGAVAAPHQVLQAGSHGEEVKQAQRKLSRVRASALPLVEDGEFGRSHTRLPSARFQTTSGVVAGERRARPRHLDPPGRRLRSPAAAGAGRADARHRPRRRRLRAAEAQRAWARRRGSPSTACTTRRWRAPVIVFEIVVLHRLPTGSSTPTSGPRSTAPSRAGFVALEGASGTAVEQHTPSGTARLARRTERRHVAAPGRRRRQHHHRQLGAGAPAEAQHRGCVARL